MLSLQETKEANESSPTVYHNIVYRLHWRRLNSPQAAAEIRAVTAWVQTWPGGSLFSICNKTLYWLLCSRESNLQQTEKLIWATLNNFAVFIVAAYSGALQGALNQSGSVKVYLLYANRWSSRMHMSNLISKPKTAVKQTLLFDQIVRKLYIDIYRLLTLCRHVDRFLRESWYFRQNK